ncbi:MAG: hypothetical protein H6559_35100 [Lewinellaceae bacterium]|nr:hypothetical protein [Lewinellaceae bacterium]
MINVSDTLVLEKMPLIGARAAGVLLAIAKFMNEHNQAWPSRKTLRALTGLGRDALDKDIKTLEQHQLARKSQRRTEDGRRLSSNLYAIPFSLARKYTPPPVTGFQDTETQDTGAPDAETPGITPQHTGFQDAGFQGPDFQDTDPQHPGNPPGSIEYPFEELKKQEELNKQEELRALYARACEEIEKLKRENEELRRFRLRSTGGGAEPAPPPACGAPPPYEPEPAKASERASRRASCRANEAEPEAEPEAEAQPARASRRVSCRASEAEPEAEPEPQPQFDTQTKNHTQAAETFWAWAQSRGYLPCLIANARYPGTLEQARDCCSDYFRNHQKNGRWVYIWRAPTNKNLAGFESWLARDPLFYPKKYSNEKTTPPGKSKSSVWDPVTATEAFLELCAEEGISLSGYGGVQ